MSETDPDVAGEIEQGERRGRPSLSEQLEIEQKVLPYFMEGISATVASIELGLDRKTVNRYYTKFSELRIQANDEEFIEQCKIRIESADAAISNQISRLHILQRQLDEKIKEITKLPNFSMKVYLSMIKHSVELAKSIVSLVVTKANLVNSPTADMKLVRIIKELIENAVP